MTYEAFVADGDKALVFTGETQEEASRKAQHHALPRCPDCGERGVQSPWLWFHYHRCKRAHHEGVDA